jgi:hypothetical protein
MIRVCIGCIQASHAPVRWPRPPFYGWNPLRWDPERELEPEIE